MMGNVGADRTLCFTNSRSNVTCQRGICCGLSTSKGSGAGWRRFYSEVGRPSIDPELMIRMLIVGYCFAIRWERRLCEEVHLSLAYRWFCRLGLDGAVPDHSTLSKNRHGRFRDSDLLRKVFEATVRRCIDEGLVGGEGFAVDASMIKADANRQRSVPGSGWQVPEAARTMRCGNIWPCSTMPHSVRQPRLCRSLSRTPVRPRVGRAQTAGWLSSPTAPNT